MGALDGEVNTSKPGPTQEEADGAEDRDAEQEKEKPTQRRGSHEGRSAESTLLGALAESGQGPDEQEYFNHGWLRVPSAPSSDGSTGSGSPGNNITPVRTRCG